MERFNVLRQTQQEEHPYQPHASKMEDDMKMLGTRPNFVGKIQVRSEGIEKVVYVDRGDIALWKHDDSKYTLRGYVTIDGTKYLVSLTDAE